MKILVAIASYGTNNDQYLNQLIDEYSSMPFHIDIVVLSNINKNIDSNIELIVGLPSKNPWSLPFAHKPVFAQRLEQYDLFIYSEDDTLITEQNINSFLQATEVLKEDEIAGFLRSEQGPDGALYYSTVHGYYHWDINSVRRRGSEVFAYFTNEHGACYLLTRDQLRRAIDSGGFCVPPHEGKYDMLVSAATDPYTQCGFQKLICISQLESFTCKHLTNKYIGRTGTRQADVDLQVEALFEIESRGGTVPAPVPVETRLPNIRWAKSYYEPCQRDLVAMIPTDTKRVLSLGCGWGETEAALVKKGIAVTAVPLDIVIGKLAETKGIRVISETLESGPKHLAGEKFDVLLASHLFHLVDDPVRLLCDYRDLLSDNGIVIASCPNVRHVAVIIRRLANQSEFRGLEDYNRSGIHQTSQWLVRRWFRSAGFDVREVTNVIGGKWMVYDRMTLGLAKHFFASQFAICAKKLH